MSLVLILTHLLAAAAGAGLTYVAVTHSVKRRDIDGHAVLEINHPSGDKMPHRPRSPNWTGVVLLVVGAVLIVAAGQFFLAQADRNDRDRADRAYADCLTDFATDLVTTIKNRSESTSKVSAAETRRDDAVDRVLFVVGRARQTPTAGDEKDFYEAIAAAVTARANLDRAEAEAEKVKAANQYVYPKAVCSR